MGVPQAPAGCGSRTQGEEASVTRPIPPCARPHGCWGAGSITSGLLGLKVRLRAYLPIGCLSPFCFSKTGGLHTAGRDPGLRLEGRLGRCSCAKAISPWQQKVQPSSLQKGEQWGGTAQVQALQGTIVCKNTAPML